MTNSRRMHSLELDLDDQISNLELEWHEAYDASMIARSEYRALAVESSASARELNLARARLERAEAANARVMAKIERLEESLLGKT